MNTQPSRNWFASLIFAMLGGFLNFTASAQVATNAPVELFSTEHGLNNLVATAPLNTNALLVAALTSALTTAPTAVAMPTAVAQPAAAAVAPPVATAAPAAVSRHLQPNDQLDISIYQQPDLETKVTVDDRGMIMLPLLGAVKLGGLTLEDATTLVHNLYDKDYLVDPKVTIQVVQFAVLRYTILGQVQKPGTYEFPPNEKLNLLDGVAMGGGYTRLALSSKVTIQRSLDGELKIFNLDADAMAKDPLNKPFMLLPGDTITVGERIF
ncbi:MAG: polysaccharide biosynthesis/export family protein [Verrucomicrobiota bacterium]|jgi:polysaccharide export outer membrane protein